MGSRALSLSDDLGFPDLMMIMITLAGTGDGTGHLQLVNSLGSWLETCRQYLCQKNVLEKLEGNNTSGRHQLIMESVCFMLSYLTDILKQSSCFPTNPAFGRSATPDTDEGEDSEETKMISKKKTRITMNRMKIHPTNCVPSLSLRRNL